MSSVEYIYPSHVGVCVNIQLLYLLESQVRGSEEGDKLGGLLTPVVDSHTRHVLRSPGSRSMLIKKSSVIGVQCGQMLATVHHPHSVYSTRHICPALESLVSTRFWRSSKVALGYKEYADCTR